MAVGIVSAILLLAPKCIVSIRSCSVPHRGFGECAKNIDSGQPAQFVQADLSRHLLLMANFKHTKGPSYGMM